MKTPIDDRLLSSYSEGTLVHLGGGRFRTGLRDGRVGAFPVYTRAATPNIFTPPYTFTGTFIARKRLENVWIAAENRTPTWDYGLCFQAHQDNNNNAVFRVSGALNKYNGLSVEKNNVYNKSADHWRSYFYTPQLWLVDGQQHTFEMGVPKHGHYWLKIDGKLVLEGVENTPSFTGPIGVGLRFDFFDVEIWNMVVDHAGGEGMPTYPYGYGSWATRLDVKGLESKSTWNRLHPELRRRLVEMFNAAQAVGKDLGIGGGWRSSAVQEQTFRDRHYVVASGGCCSFDGKRWQLRSGQAHAAPPGRSYHEETTPDGFALAADLIGDLWWMNENAHRFGLNHFANVNGEPWHVQPVEIPNGRSRYNPNLHVLSVPKDDPQPNKPLEEDEDVTMFVGRGPDKKAVWAGDGRRRKHVVSFEEYTERRNRAAYGVVPHLTYDGKPLPATLDELPVLSDAQVEWLGSA